MSELYDKARADAKDHARLRNQYFQEVHPCIYIGFEYTWAFSHQRPISQRCQDHILHDCLEAVSPRLVHMQVPKCPLGA